MSPPEPLQADLVSMLLATRELERALYARLSPDQLTAPLPDGEWSPADVLGHLAAWRGIEARRLAGTAAQGDPLPGDDVEASNARLHAQRVGTSAESIEAEADASLEQLISAIRSSSAEALCECDQLVAGIGANGINHAIGHLSDIARLAGDTTSYREFAAGVERVLRGSHLPPRDSGVLLYNLACHSALTGDLDDARRLLGTAIGRRPDLGELAGEDPDLVRLRDHVATGDPGAATT